MGKRKMTTHRHMAAVLSLSLLIAGSGSISAQADFVDDVKETLNGAGQKAGEVLDQIGVGPVIRKGYDTVTDFVFTYETQPDDDEMENLARSWAITAWLADENRGETNIYYFDNHTLTMVKDLTQIKKGYNLSKTPEGSILNGKHTGVLKAVVKDATNYTVEWANYDDEVNLFLLQKMKSQNGNADAETEKTDNAEAAGTNAAAGSTDAAAADAAAGSTDAAVTDATGNTGVAVTDAAAGNTGVAVTDAAGNTGVAVTDAAGNTGVAVTDAAGNTGVAVTDAAGNTGVAVTDAAAGNTAAAVTDAAAGDTGAAATDTSAGNVITVAGGAATNNVTAVAGGTVTQNVTTVAG